MAPGHAGRREQYWTFAGVAAVEHEATFRALPVSYDITVISARPMGWERPKTQGHVHVGRGAQGGGFPELYEVLRGRAGFLVQNLLPGPTATLCTLVEANAGDVVVIPPRLHHVTINLGEGTLVVADVVCRASDDAYHSLRAAQGMAYYLRTDDTAAANPHYRAVPPLERVDASSWSRSDFDGLQQLLTASDQRLGWLCDEGAFGSIYPALWRRVVGGLPRVEGA